MRYGVDIFDDEEDEEVPVLVPAAARGINGDGGEDDNHNVGELDEKGPVPVTILTGYLGKRRTTYTKDKHPIVRN